MKLQFLRVFLFAASGMFLFSCSDDAQNATPPTPEVQYNIQQITHTAEPASSEPNYTMDFNYENGILQNTVTSFPSQPDIFRSEYVYDGNKISAIDYFQNNGAQPYSTTTFTYAGNLLTQRNAAQDRTEYTYSGESLSGQKYYYLYPPEYGLDPKLIQQNSYTYDSGNILEDLQDYKGLVDGNGAYIARNVHAYDSKNNPLRYMNPYFRIIFKSENFNGLSNSNITSTTTHIPVDSADEDSGYDFEYTYNSDNYPTQIKKYYKSGHQLISTTDIAYQ
jgi:hypothetical protein